MGFGFKSFSASSTENKLNDQPLDVQDELVEQSEAEAADVENIATTPEEVTEDLIMPLTWAEDEEEEEASRVSLAPVVPAWDDGDTFARSVPEYKPVEMRVSSMLQEEAVIEERTPILSVQEKQEEGLSAASVQALLISEKDPFPLPSNYAESSINTVEGNDAVESEEEVFRPYPFDTAAQIYAAPEPKADPVIVPPIAPVVAVAEEVVEEKIWNPSPQQESETEEDTVALEAIFPRSEEVVLPQPVEQIEEKVSTVEAVAFIAEHPLVQEEKQFIEALPQPLQTIPEQIISEHTPSVEQSHSTAASNEAVLMLAKSLETILEKIDARCEALDQKTRALSELSIEQTHAHDDGARKIDVSRLEKKTVDMGELQVLLDNPKVTDIMVNGPTKVFAEIGGVMQLTDVTFESHEALVNLAERIALSSGRVLDEDHLLVDSRLPDGSRVNIVAPPLALDGVSISIRKFGGGSITLDTMVTGGVLSQQACEFLKLAARNRVNIIVSGGTGTGKTTLLNSLSRHIGEKERVVTIEDSAELQLQQPHVVRLEASQGANSTHDRRGAVPITIRDLVKNALRMRPERIVVGESRGAEAFDMVQAMNTGHDGSFTSIHANTPRDVVARLENMIGMANLGMSLVAIRKQIASAVHIIIQTTRLECGSRRITHITEVVGMEGEMVTMQDIFTMKYLGQDENGKAKTVMMWENTFPRHKALNAAVRAADILK